MSARNVTDAELQQMRQLVRKLATVLGDVADLRCPALPLALTKFDRMALEVGRDRLATDPTIDRAFIAVLDKLLATKVAP